MWNKNSLTGCKWSSFNAPGSCTISYSVYYTFHDFEFSLIKCEGARERVPRAYAFYVPNRSSADEQPFDQRGPPAPRRPGRTDADGRTTDPEVRPACFHPANPPSHSPIGDRRLGRPDLERSVLLSLLQSPEKAVSCPVM